MTLAQRLLERIVQLLGRELLALLQVQSHELIVELDDLIDDLRVRGLHGGEIRRAPVRLEEAIDDAVAAGGGEIQRQALGAKRLAQILQHLLAVRVAAVDLVDDDQPAQPALAREFHQALREGVDAGRGAHDHRDRLDRFEHRQRLAEKVRVAGGVDEVDVDAVAVDAADGGVERVLQALFLRIEVRHRGAAREAAAGADRAGLQQQRLEERGLARAGLADQRDITDARSRVPHGECSPGS